MDGVGIYFGSPLFLALLEDASLDMLSCRLPRATSAIRVVGKSMSHMARVPKSEHVVFSMVFLLFPSLSLPRSLSAGRLATTPSRPTHFDNCIQLAQFLRWEGR